MLHQIHRIVNDESIKTKYSKQIFVHVPPPPQYSKEFSTEVCLKVQESSLRYALFHSAPSHHLVYLQVSRMRNVADNHVPASAWGGIESSYKLDSS
jgi:hypothetical protein